MITIDSFTFSLVSTLGTRTLVYIIIGRCEYKVTADFIMQYFDPVASQFKECSEAAAVNPGLFRKLKILEGQVTWLVHIMASIIEGRLGMNASEEGDRLDGQLTGRVIALQQWHEARLTQHGCNGCSLLLENAFVHFYKSFKKIYIGDHSLTQSKAFEVLQDMVGIPNHIGVLNLMVHNITNNLRYWTDPSIIESTLQLFQELTSGYSTSRHMTKVETVQFILKNHSKDTFSFQESPGNFKSRTIFYSTLVKLLFMTPDDWEDRFNEFMIPFEKTFHYLNSLPSAETFRADSTKLVLMGMFRDLRGIASACSQRKPYTIFFEWVYERIKDLIIKVVELWFDCPELINIVLKFWSEFVQNRNQRLTFDSSSANGLLLFKHTSLLLKTLGSRLVTLPPRNDPWKDRYKLIHSFLLILHYSLGGNYCNFGVFELYQDPALTQALEVVLGLAFSIPRNELMSYPKLSKSFFDVIDSVTKSHLSVAIKCNDQILPSILQVVHDGLKSVAVSISSLCCTALEHICVQRYNALKKNNTVLIELFNSQSEQFGLILKTILTAVIFEDWPNQWSLSRPLFVLLLTNEQAYVILREEIIRSQAVERQEALMKAFEALTDVKKTLDATSRDKFSSLCNTFRVDVKAILGN